MHPPQGADPAASVERYSYEAEAEEDQSSHSLPSSSDMSVPTNSRQLAGGSQWGCKYLFTIENIYVALKVHSQDISTVEVL